MKTQDLINIAIVAGVAYIIWSLAPTLKKGRDEVANWIADFYLWMTLPDSMIVQGNVAMPDGSLVPLAHTDVRQKEGIVVAKYQGHFYQLSPSDENGNWPGELIQ